MIHKIYKHNKNRNANFEALKIHLIAISILFLLNIVVNSSMEIKGFFMDDLSYWSAFHNMNDIDFIFNTVANKFRPIANIFMLIGFKLMQYNTGFSDGYLLFFNFLAVLTLYIVVYKITNKVFFSALAGVLYIFSNFAYYQIIQFFGVMESVGLIFATLSLYFMYRFINGKTKYFWLSNVSILCALFSHERYMVLYIVLIIATFLYQDLSSNKKLLTKYAAIALLFLVFIITSRYMIIGSRAFDGTGGTSVADSLDILRVFKFIRWSCLNMFGINAGEAYLNGITFKVISGTMQLVAIVFASCLFWTIGKVLYTSIKYKRWQEVRNIILFVLFIGGCIISSCTTIRLEMRWLYTPFVGMIVLFCYCLKCISCYNDKKRAYNTYIIALIVVCAFVPLEFYYRAHYGVIYCFPSQNLYNEFYELIYEKYDGQLYEKPVVFLEKTQIYYNKESFMSWLKEYKQDADLKDPEIHYYNHAFDIDAEIMNKEPIIVFIDSSNTVVPKIFDMTEEINDYYTKNNVGTDMRIAKLVDGFYGWEGDKSYSIIGKEASLYIKSGNTGKVRILGQAFEFNNPNKLTLRFNGVEVGNASVDSDDIDIEIQTNIPANTVGTLEIELENARVPYEIGIGEDRRQIGMIISDIIMN